MYIKPFFQTKLISPAALRVRAPQVRAPLPRVPPQLAPRAHVRAGREALQVVNGPVRVMSCGHRKIEAGDIYFISKMTPKICS